MLRQHSYVGQIDRAEKNLAELGIEVEAVCADSAYGTALIHKAMEERGLKMYTPLKDTSESSRTEYKRDDFSYNKSRDTFICPHGIMLTLRNLQRTETGVYRQYRADVKMCKMCPHREKCLAPSQKSRKILVNIFQHIVDDHHARDDSAEYREVFKKRQIWCEGTFAVQKARHNLRNLFRRGLWAAQDHCLLSAIALNLKRLVKCIG
jgi:hypothetical protein